jgi:hypothetical protein
MSSFKPVTSRIIKIVLLLAFVFCAGFVFYTLVKAEKNRVVQEFKLTLWTMTVFEYLAQEGILPCEFEFSVKAGPNNNYVQVSIFVDGKLYCKSEVNDKRQGLLQAIEVSEIARTNAANKALQLIVPLCLNYVVAAKGVNLTEGGKICMKTDEFGGKWVTYYSAVLTVGNHWSVYVNPKGDGFTFHGGM